MELHGNSLSNPNPHHLYVIYDHQEQNVFKYGISDDPIENDGLSRRIRTQIDFLNRAMGSERFTGKVLFKNIPGRAAAKAKEDELIDLYFDEFKKKPRGNPIGGTHK